MARMPVDHRTRQPIRSIREGFVYGLAKPYHLGKSTQVWSIEITNEKKQLISINRLTMMVLAK